jgi:hypothetical protein
MGVRQPSRMTTSAVLMTRVSPAIVAGSGRARKARLHGL